MWFGTDGSRRMNPIDFGDHLNLQLAPPAGQSCHLSCNLSQHLLNEFSTNVCPDICGPQRMTPTDFGDPLTFHLAPPPVKIFNLSSALVGNQIPALY